MFDVRLSAICFGEGWRPGGAAEFMKAKHCPVYASGTVIQVDLCNLARALIEGPRQGGANVLYSDNYFPETCR